MPPSASPWQQPELIRHAERILSSYHALTGKPLLNPPSGSSDSNPREAARHLYQAPMVVLSHGTEADPILNYGNHSALELFSMPWETFTRTPSRFTAETPARAEREQLLQQVTAQGYIHGYSGVRISADGQRFRISEASVWNVFDLSGTPLGQAAAFTRWQPIEPDT